MKFLSVLAALALAVVPAAAHAQDAFPVAIEHVYGSTTIEEAPERIVTWGWGAHDAAIALGAVPVAIPYFDYGGDENGMLPWTLEALRERGAEMPGTLDNVNDEPPVEQIAAARPDLIIAVYSGLTEQQYNTLSRIAPVVAYPEEPWATPWRDVIRLTGEALGKADEADTLVGGLENFMAAEAKKRPALAGTTFAGVASYNEEIAVYAERDPRMEFLEDLGMQLAPSVTELAPENGSFFYSLSLERADQLVSDILIGYFATEDAGDAFFGQPTVEVMPQVEQGAIAAVVGEALVSSIGPPTALSLEWGLPRYLDIVAEAARQAGD